jgi:hypothetical protein
VGWRSRVADNLISKVVPCIVLGGYESGDANQGGEMEVLVRQADEFDAALLTRQGVT